MSASGNLSAGEVRAILSEADLLRLVAAFGGVEIDIPRGYYATLRLARTISEQGARTLIAACPGGRAAVPSAHALKAKKGEIIDAARRGANSRRQIAITVGVSKQYVCRVLGPRAQRDDDAQGDMFGDHRDTPDAPKSVRSPR